ncbi:MAG: DUF507 family protein [Nitrospinales bacterium]
MKLNREKINHISSLIVQDFERRDELDYKVSLNELRLHIVEVMTEQLQIEDNADTETRKILASYTAKPLREGTPEWDILYQKHFDEYMNKHGVSRP